MRTTITLDDDVAAEIAARQRSERRSFKEIVNDTLRAGLHPQPVPNGPDVRHTTPRSLGAGPDIADISATIALLDQPGDEDAHQGSGS